MMKIKIAAFLVAWITIASTFASAQTTVSLGGKVIDADNKPLDGATIYLINGKDSTLVKTALADVSGVYNFNIKPGRYRLSIIMMGYKAYKSALLQLDRDKTMEPVILQMAGTSLKEVNVSAQRPFVQQKIDRTIINPEALISNSGSTALEVLEKAPGVIVDQNGAISLKGKGVTIFIDDKPTYLSGIDLENYLKSLRSCLKTVQHNSYS